MYIEKASRIMRELSNTKRISNQNSFERAHSHSINRENSESWEPSPLIPSTRISLLEKQSDSSNTFNANFVAHLRNRTMNSSAGKNFKSLTQKNSFIGKSAAKPSYLKRGKIEYRGSCQTSATRNNSLNKNIANSYGTKRNLSISQDSPLEVENNNFLK